MTFRCGAFPRKQSCPRRRLPGQLRLPPVAGPQLGGAFPRPHDLFGLLAPSLRRVGGFLRHCAPSLVNHQPVIREWAVDFTAVITVARSRGCASLAISERPLPRSKTRASLPGPQTSDGASIFPQMGLPSLPPPRAFEANRWTAPAVNPGRLDGRVPCPDPAERRGAWLHPFRGLAPLIEGKLGSSRRPDGASFFSPGTHAHLSRCSKNC